MNGLEGICMFVWECINTEGQHIGMCVDTFMFGSCCAHNLTTSQIAQLPDSSEPAILYMQPGIRPPISNNRPYRPKPKPTTVRPAFYLPNHNDGDRGSSFNGRPVHNQMRPNNINSMYSSMDKSDTNWSTSTKPSYSPFPTPSQHFQNTLPDRFDEPAKHDESTSQSSVRPLSSVQLWTTASTELMQTAASNLRPNFVSRPTILSTVLPVQQRHNSSHFFISTTASGTITTVSTTTDNWHNQNWESNEIDDISNNIDSNNVYSQRPYWHSSTQHPFMSWNKPSSSKAPPFITKPKPWHSISSKYPHSTSPLVSSTTIPTTSHKYQTLKPFTSTTTEFLSSTMPLSSSPSSPTTTTTVSVTYGPKPSPSHSTTQLVSASNNDKGTQCGISPMQPPRHEIRIVGGRNAQFGVWAWQVSVRRTSFFGFSSTHRCGGALLNENWIATAGHCVDDLLTSQIKIRVGEYDFSSIQEPYPFAERGVAKKVVHPKYNFFTYEYDLAMVRLDSPLEYAPHIVPICLPGSDDLLIGENATVTGWGRLSEGGTLPSVLQEVSVPIVSNDKCKNMFLRAGRHEYIPDIFMCAGFDNGGRDSCQGDSGGPLQVKGKDGRYFLAGIISWGIGCAEANLPGVCTRISKFVPWILQTVT